MTGSETLVARARVVSATRVSPHFMRIELGGEELAEFGVDGPHYDQRFKLIFPSAGHRLPDLRPHGERWYPVWEALPEAERGAMRSYSVRDVCGAGADRRLLVDFVLHLEPGATGPASSWAASAAPGDEVIVVGPRLGTDWGGIEYEPGDAVRVVLAGDETAVPAISRILGDLPGGVRGHAFCEVPTSADVLEIVSPEGVEVTWLPRDGADLGERLIAAVLGHLGAGAGAGAGAGGGEPVPDEEVDDDLWETPTFSSSDADLDEPADGIPGLYVWIAGESKVVTTLRRHLVNDLGVDRRQVAFMGYWRRGVAMRG
ncbi:MAG: siderophore-interacting protein [Aeromicrobium sp.]|uniref:siderophore-interacting protein n=1 Tax=Aeromicrobium sp. TaxID=1871063 RepID=UPI0039E70D1A